MAKAAKKESPPAPDKSSNEQSASGIPKGINPTVWKNLPQSEKDRHLSERPIGPVPEPPEISQPPEPAA